MDGKDENVLEILTPYDKGDSVWAKNFTDSGAIDDFCAWREIDYFFFRTQLNTPDTILKYGKYAGYSVRAIYDVDKEHLELYISKLDGFYVTEEFIKEWVTSGYNFLDDTIHNYRQKLCDYTTALWLKENRQKDEVSLPSNSYISPYIHTTDGLDWQEVYSNSDYNDNLDLDQQSQEYWDSL